MSRKYSSTVKYDLQQNIKPKLAPLTVAVTGALAASSLQAATITVDSLSDNVGDSGCELRAAIVSATTGGDLGGCTRVGGGAVDEIVFESGLSGTIQLDGANAIAGFEYGADNSSLAIGNSMSIDGDNRITVRGTGNGSVFQTKYDSADPSAYEIDTVSLSNITITNGGGEQRGGGIYARSRYLLLDNVNVSDNVAIASGAGIHHVPLSSFNTYDKGLQIIGSTISGNDVLGIGDPTGGGGGVYADLGGYGGTVLIASTTFDDNTSLRGNGGALHLRSQDYSTLTIKYSEFSNNEAKYAAGSGGGAFVDMGYLTASLYDNEFGYNNANSSGGGLYLTESLPGIQQAEVTLTDNTFEGNQANDAGGGAFISVVAGTNGTIEEPVKFVNVTNNTFNGNSSDGPAAGLRLDLGDTVTSNISESRFSTNYSQSGFGGGSLVTAQSTRIYVSDSYFGYNTAAGGGGGGLQVSLPDSSFGMQETDFFGNRAEGGCGGGLRLSDGASELGVGRSVLYRNYSSSCGGGMSMFVPNLENAIVEFKYNEVSYNTAAGSGSVGGGGIFASLGDGTSLFVKNSTISGNQATGAVGGGIHFQGDMTAELKYATVANNTSDGDGGGVFNAAATCNISDTILAGNTGNGTLYQDLRGSTLCGATDSLIAGAKYSTFTNNGGNILNTDPLLEPLSGNGGRTFTHALQPDSPAIDAGTAGTFAPDTDQRGPGFPRVVGSALDMGAYEVFSDSIFSDRFQQTPP